MEPYHIVRPFGGLPSPVLFDSPHSGRDYPDDFRAAAPPGDLRRAEDAYVDELIEGAAAHGVTALIALAPRCYIDLNRAADDVDPATLLDPRGVWNPTEKSRRGLGLIRQLVVPGVPVYDRRLEETEVIERVRRCYRPYHDALDRLIRELHERHGRVVHVNWHSMKSVGNVMTPDGEGARRPAFVVGDRHGASAAPAITGTIVRLLRAAGCSVAVNEPYAGGAIVHRTGNPEAGIHSVQIEINRGLYLDEARVEKTGGFATLLRDLDGFTEALVTAIREMA